MLENSEKLLILISKVLEVNKSEINDNTPPKNIRNWDSFNTLKIIL